MTPSSCAILTLALALLASAAAGQPAMGPERVVMTTDFGDIEVGFYPDIAPITVPHILKLFQLGAYNTNHIFRLDAGFVAQVSGVSNGRTAPLTTAIKKEDAKTVPLEISQEVTHLPGTLSMARHSDPNSGGSSFSMLLGEAAHLNGQYTIFGNVTKGFENLKAMESVETFTEGIFVKPVERITIHSTYWYSTDGVCAFVQ
eukprot:evm.model.scf_3251.1 EVM.evm.TU.scf_3251.1   scf_3251:3471-6907(-)